MNKLYKLVPVMAALAAAQNAFAGAPIELPPSASVPVPAAWLLMGVGAVALYLFRRK